MTARLVVSLAALLLATPAMAAPADDPFGRDPADPVSSFALKDKAGNLQLRMVVPAPDPARRDGERCMPGTELCFSATKGEGLNRVELTIREVKPDLAAEQVTTRSLSLPIELSDDTTELAIWPLAVKRVGSDLRDSEGEALLIGVLATDRVGYSGGGGGQTMLWLYRIDNAGTNRVWGSQVLSVLQLAGQMIRACFSEADMESRMGACHDETHVETTLLLDPANTAAMPRLRYSMTTQTWPGTIPQQQDERADARLRKSDLVWSADKHCSYARTVQWNPASLRYEFDTPAPDCRLLGAEQ